MTAPIEKRALQIVVGIACLVPILAGGSAVISGPPWSHAIDLDSHFRYLSGLLLGIGIAYASGIPGIERRSERFVLLGCIVIVGGLGRLVSLLAMGPPSGTMIAALVMELGVTPAITLWQLHVARNFRTTVRASS